MSPYVLDIIIHLDVGVISIFFLIFYLIVGPMDPDDTQLSNKPPNAKVKHVIIAAFR